MRGIFSHLLSDTWLGRQLDGKKTVIGGTAVVLSAVLHGLEGLAPLFPQVAWISPAAGVVRQVLGYASEGLDAVGLPLLTLGLAHKELKRRDK